MAYWKHAEGQIGCFEERDTGNHFEYSVNDDAGDFVDREQFPHKVWVGGLINDAGYRYARVLKTRAYICVDEDEYGRPVVEKWYFKDNWSYA